ncbi:MAG: 50S ribosomal protein L32 [Pikeienuella sp.]
MLMKFLIFVGVIVGVFVVARMGAASANSKKTLFGNKKKSKSSGSKKRGSDQSAAEDLVPCSVCGAFITSGEICSCRDTPTP